MSGNEERSNSELLAELEEWVTTVPKRRMHVHPSGAHWIAMAVANVQIGHLVQVVPDPSCRESGSGWVEDVTADQWRSMRELVGSRVIVQSSLPTQVGRLVSLDHREAVVDSDDGDRYYLPWITIRPAAEVVR